jgi:hypothetical protein
MTTLDTLQDSLCLCEGSHTEYPLHGLVNEALTQAGYLHTGGLYISIKSPPKHSEEQISESKVADLIVQGSSVEHFSFTLDKPDVNECAKTWPLDAAAHRLADWYRNSQKF